jgi:hypothetical protein
MILVIQIAVHEDLVDAEEDAGVQDLRELPALLDLLEELLEILVQRAVPELPVELAQLVQEQQGLPE